MAVILKSLIASYFKLQPPSIFTISPCIETAFPEAKNKVKSAISSGLVLYSKVAINNLLKKIERGPLNAKSTDYVTVGYQ